MSTDTNDDLVALAEGILSSGKVEDSMKFVAAFLRDQAARLRAAPAQGAVDERAALLAARTALEAARRNMTRVADTMPKPYSDFLLALAGEVRAALQPAGQPEPTQCTCWPFVGQDPSCPSDHKPATQAEQAHGNASKEPMLWAVIDEMREAAHEALVSDPSVGIRPDQEHADLLTEWANRLEGSAQAFYEDVYSQCCAAIKAAVDAGELPASVVEAVQMMVRTLSHSPAPASPPALPDMRAVCKALGFDPTNHHNAAKCPYCRPASPLKVPEPLTQDDLIGVFANNGADLDALGAIQDAIRAAWLATNPTSDASGQ